MDQQPEKRTAKQLIDELESLQEAGDEIRSRINETMKELEDNAEKIRVVTKQQADDHKTSGNA
jgi:hypothetical protein